MEAQSLPVWRRLANRVHDAHTKARRVKMRATTVHSCTRGRRLQVNHDCADATGERALSLTIRHRHESRMSDAHAPAQHLKPPLDLRLARAATTSTTADATFTYVQRAKLDDLDSPAARTAPALLRRASAAPTASAAGPAAKGDVAVIDNKAAAEERRRRTKTGAGAGALAPGLAAATVAHETSLIAAARAALGVARARRPHHRCQRRAAADRDPVSCSARTITTAARPGVRTPSARALMCMQHVPHACSVHTARAARACSPAALALQCAVVSPVRR